MKKLIVIFVVIIAALVLLLTLFKNLNKSDSVKPDSSDDEDVVVEIPQDQMPFVSLTPTNDGHFLKMKIENIKIANANSVDYELVYKVKDGRTQGVPGSVKLNGQTMIERELLLGSESSGKFRYDEGVNNGVFTLTIRDAQGKLLGRKANDFVLLSKTKEGVSSDSMFKFTFSKQPKGYFVVMNTFGTLNAFDKQITYGPYGVFTVESDLKGTVDSANAYYYSGGNWVSLDSSVSVSPQVFIISN